MDIVVVNNAEYKQLVSHPFTKFEDGEFYQLNASKVDEVKYFVFNNGKNRFSFVGGLKNGVLCFPFSASFECLSEIIKDNRMSHYHDTVDALLDWGMNNSIKHIKISLPPFFYASSHISKFANALFVSGFKLSCMDVNYEYYLDDFNDNYEKNIDIKSRQKLRKSYKENLSFYKVNEFDEVYDIIRQNRESKGYPLWMHIEDLSNTSRIIPTDLFIVKNSNGLNIASAVCHHITPDVVRVVYWGNIPGSDHLCPMNFISYNIFKYYKDNTNIKIIDIGTSTEDSIPNYGLCDFKEGIGCQCSQKQIFTWDRI